MVENSPVEEPYVVPPEGDGYDWIWEDWVKEQQEKREAEPDGASEANWMEAFEQYFYGDQDDAGNEESGVERQGNQNVGQESYQAVRQQSYQVMDHEHCQVMDHEHCQVMEQQQHGEMDRRVYQAMDQQVYETITQPIYEATEQACEPTQQAYNTTTQQAYNTITQPYNTTQHDNTSTQPYHPTPIPTIPEYPHDAPEPIPTVSLLPPPEETINLYNTDQCIHTYNVVNTVEEVATAIASHADPHARRYPHPTDRTHENRRRNHRVRTVLSPATHPRQRPLRQGGVTALLAVDSARSHEIGGNLRRSFNCFTPPMIIPISW